MALSRTYGLKIAGSGSTGMAMAIETRISPDKVPPTVGPEGFELPATSAERVTAAAQLQGCNSHHLGEAQIRRI